MKITKPAVLKDINSSRSVDAVRISVDDILTASTDILTASTDLEELMRSGFQLMTSIGIKQSKTFKKKWIRGHVETKISL